MKRTGISLVVIGVVVFGLALPTLGRQSQQEMNRQADADYKKADGKLNAAYKKLMAKLPRSRQAKLKTAQLAWLKFRDAESAFAGSEMEGGSAEPMLISGAMASLTNERTKALDTAYQSPTSR